jgi:hypothetical protein
MKGCPEILRDGATYVVAIAGQARACTSTRRPTGLSLTSYTVSIGGQRSALPFEGNESERLIWGMATRELMRPEGALREVFFYGTAVQLTPDKWAEQARILAQ